MSEHEQDVIVAAMAKLVLASMPYHLNTKPLKRYLLDLFEIAGECHQLILMHSESILETFGEEDGQDVLDLLTTATEQFVSDEVDATIQSLPPTIMANEAQQYFPGTGLDA